MSKQPTLSDIASRAGVSSPTVSRVFNRKKNVAPSTVERILTATRALGGGVPVTLVGVIVPNSSNPFFAELGFQFESEFKAHGGYAIVSSSNEKPAEELRLIERFRALDVEGLVYVSTGEQSDTLLSLIADGTFPTLVLDRKVPAGNLDFVTVNSRKGTLSAVDYLVVHGHSRIGYLKGKPGTGTAEERLESFREAMAQNHQEPVEAWEFQGDYTPESGEACAERLLGLAPSERPTALLAANDLMAIGLMQRLQRQGWKLPEQLSVIGFDGIPWSKWVYPRLTTIEQPINQLVRESVRLLMRRIEETCQQSATRRPPEHRQVESRLIPRESVTNPLGGSQLRLIKTTSGSPITS